MKKFVLGILNNSLIRGTGIFFIGNILINFGGFAFHLIVARLIGPIEYGILGSLTGLTYFLSIPMAALDIVLTKTLSSYDKKEVPAQSRNLIIKIFNKTKWLNIFLVFLMVLSTKWVASFLKLDNSFGVLLVWVSVCVSIVTAIGLAILRSMLKFKDMVLNQIIAAILKIGLTVFIVLLFFRNSFGALVGTVLAAAVALVILFYQIRFIFKPNKQKISKSKINLLHLGVTSLLFSAAFSSMYSLDIVLVKHFFDPFLAGIYSALATSGKIVFFAMAPIAVAILPLVSRKSNKSELRHDLLLITGISLVIGSLIVLAFFLIPNLIITVLFTAKFSDAIVYLPWFGFAMLGYAMANILGSFLLSINKTQVAGIAVAGVVCEIASLLIFNTTLWQVITILGVVFWSMVVIMFATSYYDTREAS